MKLQKILIASGIGIVSAFSVAFGWNFIYKNSKLPETACFASYSLSNMNCKDVENLVKSEINPKIEKTKLKVTFENFEFPIYLKDFNAHLEADDIFKYAKNKHKQSNKNLNPEVKYDRNRLLNILEYFKEKTKIEPKKFGYNKKSNNQIEVTAGCDGKEIDSEKTADKIAKILNNPKFVELSKKNLIKPIEAEFRLIKDPESSIDLEKLKKEVDVPVKDAKFSIENGQRKYEKETVGVNLDISEAKKNIKNPKKGTYEISTKKVPPNKTVAQIKKEQNEAKTPNLLSTFTTTFGNNNNRNHNIKLAASAINGKCLLPGEEFSFDRVAGHLPGYKEATIYEHGRVAMGFGGGVCQVVSTIFNAVCKAGLKITRRQCHSLPVYYVLPGRDATYSSGGTDFRFVNSLNNKIIIEASATNRSITIKILGTDEGVKGNLSSKVTLNSPERINTISTLIVTKNGQQIRSQTFSSSYAGEGGKHSKWASRGDKEQTQTVAAPPPTQSEPPQPAAPPVQPHPQPAPPKPSNPQPPAAQPQPPQPAAPPPTQSEPPQPAAPPAQPQPQAAQSQPANAPAADTAKDFSSLQQIKEGIMKTNLT